MKTALPLLLTSVLAAAPTPHAAQKHFGSVTLGSVVYHFRPESLSASSSKPMALYLRGRLVPAKGGKSLAFSFTLYRPGPLGGMMLAPRTGKGAQWIATLQSKVDASFPNPPKLGDEAVFTFSGPLLRSEGARTTESTWQGQIKADFTSVP